MIGLNSSLVSACVYNNNGLVSTDWGLSPSYCFANAFA